MNVRHIPAAVDWIHDGRLQELDEAACAAAEQRTEFERAMTFDELLDELDRFDEARRQAFLEALFSGQRADWHTLYILIDQAKDKVIDAKMAELAEGR